MWFINFVPPEELYGERSVATSFKAFASEEVMNDGADGDEVVAVSVAV